MKHLTLIPVFGILFVFSGCRTVKERMETEEYIKQQSSSSSRNQLMQLYHDIDSTGQYWFFSTDTPFYYHPDSGLLAGRGVLSFWEQRLKKEFKTSLRDSIHSDLKLQETYSNWQRYFKQIKQSHVLWLISMFLVAAIIWYALRW